MNEPKPFTPTQRYRVQVGLAECTVTCASEQEAVHKARRQLKQEMPHLAQIIRGIQDKDFRVDAVG